METTDNSQHLQRAQTMEERIWIDSNTSQIDELLRINYDKTVEEFSDILLTAVADLLESLSGAFYIVDHVSNEVYIKAGYACKIENVKKKKFTIGEDLIGFAVKSKKVRHIEELPLNNVVISSSLANVNAISLLISPLIFNDIVYGVLELNCIRKLLPKELLLIERLSRNIASTLQSIINNEKNKELLVELREKTNQMEAQEEELRQNLEELSAIQEDMTNKQVELKGVKQKLEEKEKTLLRAMERAKKKETQLKDKINELEKLNEELTKQNKTLKEKST